VALGGVGALVLEATALGGVGALALGAGAGAGGSVLMPLAYHSPPAR
jgi:hypothetical protein